MSNVKWKLEETNAEQLLTNQSRMHEEEINWRLAAARLELNAKSNVVLFGKVRFTKLYNELVLNLWKEGKDKPRSACMDDDMDNVLCMDEFVFDGDEESLCRREEAARRLEELGKLTIDEVTGELSKEDIDKWRTTHLGKDYNERMLPAFITALIPSILCSWDALVLTNYLERHMGQKRYDKVVDERVGKLREDEIERQLGKIEQSLRMKDAAEILDGTLVTARQEAVAALLKGEQKAAAETHMQANVSIKGAFLNGIANGCKPDVNLNASLLILEKGLTALPQRIWARYRRPGKHGPTETSRKSQETMNVLGRELMVTS